IKGSPPPPNRGSSRPSSGGASRQGQGRPPIAARGFWANRSRRGKAGIVAAVASGLLLLGSTTASPGSPATSASPLAALPSPPASAAAAVSSQLAIQTPVYIASVGPTTSP